MKIIIIQLISSLGTSRCHE